MSLIHFTDDSFENEVLKYEGVALVDFWAPWCGPCQALGPVIEEIANEYEGKAKIGKVNVDEEREVAQKYMVMSIPTVLVMKNGEVVNTLVGLRPKEDYLDAIDFAL
ncbi:thioredoxin [Patescibacteria group bacterium]|nr:thioredoxin [Patescibacteria group bacterium]